MVEQANFFAYLALILVVPATILAFHYFRPTVAVLVVFLGSLMFLPERVTLDAPGLPPFDKHTIPLLCLLVGAWFKARERVIGALPGRGMDLFIVGGLLAVIGTVFTNGDPLVYGRTRLPGLGSSDAISYFSDLLLGQGAAFFLGRAIFRSSADARDLLKALVIGGLVYAPFVLVELRMSPQFNNWVYGYGQHSFLQTVRASGWRPMCFMAHGLALALFLCAAAYSAWQLDRARVQIFGFSARPIAIALTILLALANSMGALVYGIVAVLMIWFLRPRAQLVVAVALAAVIALYPWLRATGLFPVQDLVDLSARISQTRAGSLAFRFHHEDELLARALQRPLFGWGTWGRNFLFSPDGTKLSVVDGAWIASIGAWGIVGTLCRFALLLVPIPYALSRLGRLSEANQPLLAGVALAATFYALDLLPNGMFNHLPSLLSGAVLGLSVGMSTEGAARGVDRSALLRYLIGLRRSQAAAASRF